ncbi:MAG TPA: hypothetical protein VLA74_08235 [Nitrososphaeraceae archaeon]|nr:hypothetical protein [Nitrososphaeraceae archaeon]
MGILTKLAEFFGRTSCQMLVKRTANEISISGLGIDIPGSKIDIGSFSNKVIELVKATEVAVALDNSQYLLCKEISNMEDNNPLKDEYKKVRLQLLMAFNQLQGILASMRENSPEELKKELTNWIKYMSDLHKQSISLVGPQPKLIPKGGKSTLRKIMKYQGIDESELKSAIAKM